MTPVIAWFDELGKTDSAVAGRKGANLGDLCQANLPVPPGFVVTLAGYLDAMGIGGVSIGSNDLTQLMLGVDRDLHDGSSRRSSVA